MRIAMIILLLLVIVIVAALIWRPTLPWPTTYKTKAYAPAPSMSDDRLPPTSFRDAKLKCVTGGC